MPTLKYQGRTTRSLFSNISKGIDNGNIPSSVPYSSINRDDTKKDIQKYALNILTALSGGEPIKLLNDALKKDHKMKMEPLRTACNYIHIQCIDSIHSIHTNNIILIISILILSILIISIP